MEGKIQNEGEEKTKGVKCSQERRRVSVRSPEKRGTQKKGERGQGEGEYEPEDARLSYTRYLHAQMGPGGCW